ncbi:24603_t:CDS:1, partial [Gigaspora rosea]
KLRAVNVERLLGIKQGNLTENEMENIDVLNSKVKEKKLLQRFLCRSIKQNLEICKTFERNNIEKYV